jgi:nucleotide-binding universal stress UspA family protein
MVIRPIVVGVDGSEESMQAAEWAAMEAKRHSAPLRIVSAPAVMPRVHAHHAAAETVGVALRGISARALETAVARSEEVAPYLRVTTELLSGPPALAVAGSGSDASMLVVGARGTGGFAAMILGSVSRYAATRAPCPVVVVRQETMAVHREIAVGIGDPQDATETLAFAFEEAAVRGADLVVVHAWSWSAAALSLPPAPSATSEGARLQLAGPDQISAGATRALTAALDEWRDKYPKVRVRPDVIRGHPGRVLASYSARADLVVLGRHGPSGTGRAGPGIGSTLHAVLDHAHGPVAIVPGRD